MERYFRWKGKGAMVSRSILVVLWGTLAVSFALLALNAALAGEPIPSEYAGKTIPARWRNDPKVIEAGKAIYEGKMSSEVNCVMCHGSDGKPTKMGRGAPDFSDTAEQAQDSDALWFWRISEGKPGTKMPSYKNRLTDEQRWQLIVYIRSFSAKSKP